VRSISADALDQLLTMPDLIEALAEAFRSAITVPVRHHHPLERAGEPNAMLLLMPAWSDLSSAPDPGAVMGVKVVSVVPGNGARSLPSVVGAYLLLDGTTGQPVCVMDGARLTLWRTAAASALAARALARPDASRLTMVGSGALAPFLIRAHASIRPLRNILIWNRQFVRAQALAEQLAADGLPTSAVEDLEPAIIQSDIVSCATMAHEPLVLGEWLTPGTHVDLVGGFTPGMREADDVAIRRASVFVDTRAGTLKEAGDIVQPIASGALTPEAIRADLFDLARGTHAGRASAGEITLFKSVGTAIEDLAAARLVKVRLGL
jgi:ornithine cyclodeaminase